MSNLLIILVLLMTTFFSSLFSPASGQEDVFYFEGWWGSNATPVGEKVPQGGVFEVPIDMRELPFEMQFCITETVEEICVKNTSEGRLPRGTHLSSKNGDVASVQGAQVTIERFGSTTLELRQDKDDRLIASYLLVIFTPSRPGKTCVGLSGSGPSSEGVMDCSGKCVLLGFVNQILKDDVCDNGMPVDLSCSIFTDDGRSLHDARCSPDDVCKAQFGNAPGYQFCGNLTSASVCSFNATTGRGDKRTHGEDKHTRLGTCADMCQQFGSTCVAALDNETPGCTPNPKSRDTCETKRQTEICVCERR
jgi:hypothetical protein